MNSKQAKETIRKVVIPEGVCRLIRSIDKNLRVEFYNHKITESRQSSLWYGGDVCVISHTDGKKLCICANGDVRGGVYSKDTQEPLFEVVDKNNCGLFGEELINYISCDTELYSLMDETSAIKNGLYTVHTENNNWWEVFVIADDGERFEGYISDSDNFSEVVIEVARNFAEIAETEV